MAHTMTFAIDRVEDGRVTETAAIVTTHPHANTNISALAVQIAKPYMHAHKAKFIVGQPFSFNVYDAYSKHIGVVRQCDEIKTKPEGSGDTPSAVDNLGRIVKAIAPLNTYCYITSTGRIYAGATNSIDALREIQRSTTAPLNKDNLYILENNQYIPAS